MRATADAVAILPARYDSVRFPGKMLVARTGKPLIQHVYERVIEADRIRRAVIATDDERIAAAARAFGGEVVMTARDHPNGTSRLAEVARSLDDPIIVNVQGDEPEIDPRLIDDAVDTLVARPECVVATIATPLRDGEDHRDPNIVKVVLDARGRALYFSRAPIPHDRDGVGAAPPLRHVGLYVYRRAFLLEYVTLPVTPLETAERLEQLRILEHGYAIAVAVRASSHGGIDTPEQYDAFVRRVRGD